MKQLINTLLAFILAILLFSSCSKLPLHKSTRYIQPKKSDSFGSISTNYNKENSVSYGVANNDTNLYIQAIFHNKESLIKIMRSGLVLYLDSEGKKKKDYKITIEKSDIKLSEYDLLARQGNRLSNNPQQNLLASIQLNLTKITWDKKGDKIIYYRNQRQEPIFVNLPINKQNELMLEIKIPVSELPLANNEKLLSVGIETGVAAPANGKNSGGQGNGMRPAGNGMSGRGGGMGGHGGGGRGMKGGMKDGGSPQASGAATSRINPLRIWFQVQLN